MVPKDAAFCREVALGVSRYVATHGGSGVLIDPAWEPWPDLSEFDVQAVVAYAGPPWVDRLLEIGLPAVNIASRYIEHRLPSVRIDNLAIGRLAAGHFKERGIRRVALIKDAPHYAELRRQGFCEALGDMKLVGELDSHALSAASDHRGRLAGLADWLRGLPSPIGVFASTDGKAVQTLDAAKLAGRRVPDDVAVLGVDNDEMTCLLSNPPLSSVDPAFEEVGYRAAELVRQLFDGRPAPDAPILVPPRGVVTRDSTQVAAAEDPVVDSAMRWIRAHAAEPINVEHVVQNVPVSRRALERRFKEATGASAAEMIRRVRIDTAKRLLTETDLPLEQVAERAGFGYPRQMRMVFGRLVGESPIDYRKRFAGR